MKKVFLAIVCATALFSYEATLVAKALPKEEKGYFILSDGTFWKVAPFVKRWRSLSEWWNGQEIAVPEEYNADLKSWNYGDQFAIYPKNEVCRFSESFASNEEELKQTSYALVHVTTGKILFGAPIQPAAFVTQIYDEGYQAGYSSGHSTGYGSGYIAGKEWQKLLDGQCR